jgi:hypothetical protein
MALIWAYERSRIAVVVVGENAESFTECAFFCQPRARVSHLQAMVAS